MNLIILFKKKFTLKLVNKGFFSNKVLMVRPTNFCTNYENLVDNKFMNESNDANSNQKAQSEFDQFVENLKQNRVSVEVFDQPCPEASDAVFPNNWFSTHKNIYFPEGLLIIYPMKSALRRLERNPMIIEKLMTNYRNFIDLSYLEKEGEFLESTGCLIFDNQKRRVYCSLSERASKKALKIFIESFNKFSLEPYELITFSSFDLDNNSIYHTNVLLSILENHVVLCSETIKDESEKRNVLQKLCENRKIIDLSFAELKNFGCNILMVKNKKGENVVIISQTALDNLSEKKRKILCDNYKICVNRIDVIEFIGGGSARCMVGEIFE